MVKEWTVLNKGALMRNWDRARMDQQPERIAGLDAE
jgi:hypothetical protein